MELPAVRSAEDIIRLVEELGFLPFFAGSIPGFSVEECCPPDLWFSADQDGPWEWKGPIARSGRCVYGKLFGGKAGFVSRAWFPDFSNMRRDGYDFDARYEDGLASRKDREVWETLVDREVLLSKELKRCCGYQKGGKTGFDTVITRLQMQTYVCIADFVYSKDRYGRTYGWGVAQYTTPEHLLGAGYVTSGYAREPAESRSRIENRLRQLLPDISARQLEKFLK